MRWLQTVSVSVRHWSMNQWCCIDWPSDPAENNWRVGISTKQICLACWCWCWCKYSRSCIVAYFCHYYHYLPAIRWVTRLLVLCLSTQCFTEKQDQVSMPSSDLSSVNTQPGPCPSVRQSVLLTHNCGSSSKLNWNSFSPHSSNKEIWSQKIWLL